MKAFKLPGDEKRIYFQNLNRIPAEEELAAVLKELKAAGYQVSKPKEEGLYDIYICKKDGEQFDVAFTGEETIIYHPGNAHDIEGLMKIFK